MAQSPKYAHAVTIVDTDGRRFGFETITWAGVHFSLTETEEQAERFVATAVENLGYTRTLPERRYPPSELHAARYTA